MPCWLESSNFSVVLFLLSFRFWMFVCLGSFACDYFLNLQIVKWSICWFTPLTVDTAARRTACSAPQLWWSCAPPSLAVFVNRDCIDAWHCHSVFKFIIICRLRAFVQVGGSERMHLLARRRLTYNHSMIVYVAFVVRLYCRLRCHPGPVVFGLYGRRWKSHSWTLIRLCLLNAPALATAAIHSESLYLCEAFAKVVSRCQLIVAWSLLGVCLWHIGLIAATVCGF